MNKIMLGVSIFLASLAAQAATVTVVVDDFSVGGTELDDADGTGAGVGTYSDAQRSITLTQTAGLNSVANPLLAVGTSSDPAGELQLSNNTNKNSNFTVTWALAAGLLPASASNVSFVLEGLRADLTGATVSLSFNSALLAAAQALPANTVGANYDFMLNPAQVATVSGGGNLTMSITGVPELDLSMTGVSFAFQSVPEPGSLAIMGLALAALGATRRRKA